jgi:dGTPase
VGATALSIREQTERIERETLSHLGKRSEDSRGRDFPQESCPYRTDFQRDRDRVLHSKSFRRLMHKTQVFLAPEGDHFRTRLTHTLEVSQIARTIARGLRLNEDLVEAMALGHDLGHTPFGHCGEDTLAEVCPHGFIHAEQSVRVVEVIERGGSGLNLTWEVRDGIRCHSGEGTAATQEGKLLLYADKIAYMNHDIDDAVRAGVLTDGDIPWNIRYKLGRTASERITAFVASMIASSGEGVRLDDQHQALYDELRAFMFEAVYTNPDAKREEGKARDVIRRLYAYFAAHPDKLPSEYGAIREREGVDRAVCDYISGMSDRYCIQTFENLFLPKPWPHSY